MTAPITSDQRRAFPSAPDPRRYYAASAIEEARQRIVRAVARHEGPALVVGAIGTGKSTLLAVLAEQFEPRLSVVRLPGAQICTRRALLQMVLCELHLPYRHMDEGELRLSMLEHLRGPAASSPRLMESESAKSGHTLADRGAEPPATSSAPRPRRMLVLVDEADALPTRLLEELRVLTNIAAQGMPLVSLVLAGGPILEERFADPELDKFSQRLACRCYLAPFTREETFQYVRSQVSVVGVKPEHWFDPDALAAIHAATGGAPRLVNQLGDQLVWLIEETGCQPLDAALVQQAWSDLQQLPAPWNTDAHSSLSSPPLASVGPTESSVLEFGELDAATSIDPLAPERDDFDALDLSGDSHFEVFPPDIDSGSQPPLEDDLPASIPMAVWPRRAADLVTFDASIDAAENLVEQLDEFDVLELASDAPELPAEPLPQATAENPFAEPFAEEEILVDPYAEFESQLFRSAQHVLNRIDRTFAAELARCELRKSKPVAMPAAAACAPAPGANNAVTQSPVSVGPPPRGPVVAAPESRESPAAAKSTAAPAATTAVIPGRQFRRLFSGLESSIAVRVRRG